MDNLPANTAWDKTKPILENPAYQAIADKVTALRNLPGTNEVWANFSRSRSRLDDDFDHYSISTNLPGPDEKTLFFDFYPDGIMVSAGDKQTYDQFDSEAMLVEMDDAAHRAKLIIPPPPLFDTRPAKILAAILATAMVVGGVYEFIEGGLDSHEGETRRLVAVHDEFGPNQPRCSRTENAQLFAQGAIQESKGSTESGVGMMLAIGGMFVPTLRRKLIKKAKTTTP